MIDALVTATTPYWISDLGISLTRGQSVYLSKEDADSSSSLEDGIRAGALKREWVQRFKSMKQPSYPPPPPNYQKNMVVRPPSNAAKPSQGDSADEIGKVVAEIRSYTETVSEGLSRVEDAINNSTREVCSRLDFMVNTQSSDTFPWETLWGHLERLSEAVGRIQSGGPVSGVSAPVGHGEESSVFIPSTIGSGVKGVVQVAESTTSGADEATEALRKLRSKKREK